MGQELIRVIEQISKDKGIAKDVLIEVVEAAVLSASKKRFRYSDNLEARLNLKTGEIELFQVKKVVDKVNIPEREIGLEEAKALEPEAELDSSVRVKLEPQDFGRIAAQAAKQVIIQRVREAEREIIYAEYKQREGELINGIVQRLEHRDIIVDLGRAEAILPYSEQIPRETYRRGDRVRAVLLEVKKTGHGPQLIMSRAHPRFITKLFELEVPEIYEGILEIKGIVREPGKRTKIAVCSHDDKVDPVGTCVGMRGSRVQAIVRELEGEKIDIIRWASDPKVFVSNALSPAQIKHIRQVDEETMEVVVADDQLSLAIGKKGQNARLAAKLTGWKIDIKSETQYQKEKVIRQAEERAKSLTELPGVGEKLAMDIVRHGFLSLSDIALADVESLSQVPGIGPKKAAKIIQMAKKLLLAE